MRNYLKNMKLRQKLPLLIGFIVFISSLVMIMLVTIIGGNVVKKQALDNAMEVADRYSNLVKGDSDSVMTTARTLAQSFKALKINGLADRQRFDTMLEQVLEENPSYLGVLSVWEPNALDGRDKDFVNNERSDSSGRYSPYWERGTGKICVEGCGDYEDADKGIYYLVPRATGKEMITNPKGYMVRGNWIVTATAIVPININGKFVGIVGVDYAVDHYNDLIKNIRPYGTGSAALVSNNCMYVANRDNKLVGKDIGTSDVMLKAKDAVKSGKVFTSTQHDKALKTDVYSVYVPIKIGKTDTPWSFVVNIPMDKALAGVARMRNGAIIVGLISLLVTLFCISTLISFTVIRPVNNVVAMIKDIAHGEGDLTKRLAVDGKDEIAELSSWFNTFVGKIHDIIWQVSESTNHVTSSSNVLSETSIEVGKATQQIAETIDQVASGSTEQSELVQNSVDAIEQLNKAVQEVAMGAQSQAKTVDETVSLIQQITNAISDVAKISNEAAINGQQVTEVATDGSRQVEEAVNGLNRIKEATDKVAELVDKLGSSSQQIGAIVETIDDIAEQTNLLALNAAIEAARAGEHGKGFSVVADEVRKLAERSSKATGEIAELIGHIQQMTSSAVEAMNLENQEVESGTQLGRQAGEALQKIQQAVATIVENINAVSVATDHMGSSSAEVIKAIENVSAVTEETTASAEEMSASTGEVLNHIQQVAAVSQENAASSEEVAATTQEQNASVEELTASAEELAKLAAKLQSIVALFKLSEKESAQSAEESNFISKDMKKAA